VIDCLLLAPDQGRNVNDAQKYFKGLDRRPCVWSHRELSDSRFDVDHALPFSLWRNNDLWNLFPADPAVNARKSDKLPTHRQLKGSGEIIIDYWRGLQIAMGERFEREAQTLLGRDSFSKNNWEILLFNRFVEAFEVTAVQRGAERWETSAAAARDTSSKVIRLHAPVTYYPEAEEGLICREAGPQPSGNPPLSFHEVGDKAFRTHLPILGDIAAGRPFHGFESDSIGQLEDVLWIEVPIGLARKNRFVIRVAGDSMAPTFQIGDLLVFEYHRSPRADQQIVIANIPEFGPGHSGTEAVKRISQDATSWQFHSDNPDYEPIIVPKAETNHPILGTFVGKLDRPETKRSIR
jgi:SOS-response transcriptional repressor LexA